MTDDTKRRFANPNLVTVVLAVLFVAVLVAPRFAIEVPLREWLLMGALFGIAGDVASPILKKVLP